jgi:putative transposase
MARMARVVILEYPHHVTQRGNRRQKTFFCDDDYRYCIELMSAFSLSITGTDLFNWT